MSHWLPCPTILRCIFLKLQTVFVSNCKQYLSQIAKCICLKLLNSGRPSCRIGCPARLFCVRRNTKLPPASFGTERIKNLSPTVCFRFPPEMVDIDIEFSSQTKTPLKIPTFTSINLLRHGAHQQFHIHVEYYFSCLKPMTNETFPSQVLVRYPTCRIPLSLDSFPIEQQVMLESALISPAKLAVLMPFLFSVNKSSHPAVERQLSPFSFGPRLH